MNDNITNVPRTLEHIIPIANGIYIFLYGLNTENKMIYSFSDNPDLFFLHPIVQDGQWIILGDSKVPEIYFSKYRKKQP